MAFSPDPLFTGAVGGGCGFRGVAKSDRLTAALHREQKSVLFYGSNMIRPLRTWQRLQTEAFSHLRPLAPPVMRMSNRKTVGRTSGTRGRSSSDASGIKFCRNADGRSSIPRKTRQISDQLQAQWPMKQILPRPKAAMPPTPSSEGAGDGATENTGVFSALPPAICWFLFHRWKRNAPPRPKRPFQTFPLSFFFRMCYNNPCFIGETHPFYENEVKIWIKH